MKNLIVAVLLFVPVQVQAAGIDQAIGSLWSELSQSGNFHLLDNASADVFKNTKNGDIYAGSSTYLYKYSFISADFIVFRQIEETGSLIPGSGLKLHAGELLYSIPQVKTIVDSIGKSAKMIDSVTLGIGITRDFSNGNTYKVIYGGLVKRFG